MISEGGLDCSLKLKLEELADLESNQDFSYLSPIQDGPATGSAIPQSVDLSTECSQSQTELAVHVSDPQAQCQKSPLADDFSSQREVPKCFLVCKTISEGHYKAEPSLGNIGSLQEIGASAEQKQSSKKVSLATGEQPTTEITAEDMAELYTYEDGKESRRALQSWEKNMESSYQLSSTLTDDSQVSSLQTGGNLSACEIRNSKLFKDQGTVTIPKENSSSPKCIHLEDDCRKTDSRPTYSVSCALYIKDTAKKVKQANTSQHKKTAQEETVSELQQDQKKECEDQNMREEGNFLKPKNQEEKEHNEQEQLQGEELKLKTLSSALLSETLYVPRHKVDFCCLEKFFLAEQTGTAPPGECDFMREYLGKSVLLKAHVTAVGSRCQIPSAIPFPSESMNLVGEIPVVPLHMCHISDLEELEDSVHFSISSQDSVEVDWDDKIRLGGEGEHSSEPGKTAQISDKREAPHCGRVAALSSTENPEASATVCFSTGTEKMDPTDPADPHPIAENLRKAEVCDFVSDLPSGLTSVDSVSGPQQQDASGGALVNPEDCRSSSLNKLPYSIEKHANQALSMCMRDLASVETIVLTADPEEDSGSYELLAPEEDFHEDLSGSSSFSVAYTSSLPAEKSLPGDRKTQFFIAEPLESPQTQSRTSIPLNQPETILQYQPPPEESTIMQESETGTNMFHKAQQVPLLDQSHWNPGSRISSTLNSLTWPPEGDMVLAVNQGGQPLSPMPNTTLTLLSEPDAKHNVSSPVQAQAPALNANHCVEPLALESYKTLTPVPHSGPHLNCNMDDHDLLALARSPSLWTASIVSDTNSVSSSDTSLIDKHVFVPATKEHNLCDLGTQNTENSDVSGVSLLAKDFSAVGNEALTSCSDTSTETEIQHMGIQGGKSSPDHLSQSSLEDLKTFTDSKSRDSVQSLPMLAFTNPIHFLQLSPPSPPITQTPCQEDELSGELQWEQRTDLFEGQEEQYLVSQLKEEVPKHLPLEKSSSWADRKTTGVVVQAPRSSQGSLSKHRAKSKDWHRQGLKRISVPPDVFQGKSILHFRLLFFPLEKKPADTMETFKRRHSKLINSSRLLYQEYSDVVLNKAIQSQKRVDSFAEDTESNLPSSPRLRRKVLSPQDSYLQRLSVSSNASLWQDIPMIRGSRLLLNMSRDEQKLQEAKFELIMSEASYLRSLNVAVDHFQRSADLQAVLSNQERQWLFSRLQDVRDVSASFLFDLEEKFEEDMFNFHVCDVALKHAPEFRRVYLPYVTNQTYQEQTFQRLLSGNAGFQQVLERLESDPVCQRLSLKSFLILPFQRITRLKLLLQNILKRTRPGSEEEVQATQAYDALEKLIKDCNENVQRMKSTEELIYLSQKIEFECKIFPLISQSRRLVKCGELTALDFNISSPKWKVTTRPIYLHLFNDCLLLSRPKEGGRFVVFDHAAFSDVRGEKCEMKLHGTNKNVFRLFLLQNYQGKRVEFLFRTETHSEKLRWISALVPPQGELDLLECPDAPQVQCIRSYKARENDELALEKADIIMVMQNSNDGWIEGVRLSDRERGWFPSEHVELISSKHARQKNLKEEQRVKNAKQQVFCRR
uniref:Rho guanine nucleotide exchange factor 5 n=1 Tax=Coturnix japonica TaxID=93934 RepID=A0A8C2U346_COTJA